MSFISRSNVMFLLKCPRCGNKMKYDCKGNSIIGRRKTCVYCNFSMDARKSVVQKL